MQLPSAEKDAYFPHKIGQERYASYKANLYRIHSYKKDDEVWLSHKYFIDSIFANQTSKKLGLRRYGPFAMVELVGSDDVKLKISEKIGSHDEGNVEHTSSEFSQPPEIAVPTPDPANFIIAETGRSGIFSF